MSWNWCKTILFRLNFSILLFWRFKIGRKMIKNQRLTRLLFRQIFAPQNSCSIFVEIMSNWRKTILFGLNVDILILFWRFRFGEKMIKNQRLTRLLFGQIFPPQTSAQFSFKWSQIRAKLFYLAWNFIFLFYFEGLKVVEKWSKLKS